MPGEKLTGLDVSNVGYGGGHDGLLHYVCIVLCLRSALVTMVTLLLETSRTRVAKLIIPSL